MTSATQGGRGSPPVEIGDDRITPMGGLGLVTAMVLAANVPPLGEAPRRQVASASDEGPRIDEGALYPLLENAMRWDLPVREAGTRLPDYAAIEAAPAEHRGALFTIEGHFVRQRRLVLNRSGSWGKRVTEWAIRVSDEPDGRYVIVLLADPGDSLPHPTKGTPVKTVTRFYKVWRSHNKLGETRNWLTFVGRSAKVTGQRGMGLGGDRATALGLVIALLVLIFGYVMYRARRVRGAIHTARGLIGSRLRHRSRERADGVDGGDRETTDAAAEGSAAGLPRDNEQALAELARRAAGGRDAGDEDEASQRS